MEISRRTATRGSSPRSPFTGCSLLVPGPDDFTYTGDSGSLDGGAMDAGPGDAGAPVDAGALAVPRPIFPWNGYYTGALHGSVNFMALRPVFRFHPVPGAEWYEVQLSSFCEAATRDSCDFTGAIESRADDSVWRPTDSLPVSETQPVGRRYVWRLRACNDAGCSAYSEVRYLNVGRHPGDLNGDGHVDLVVGAPGADDRGEGGAGMAYFIAGPMLRGPAALAPATAIPGAGYGAFIALVGDVNGDGYADAVVGQASDAGAPRAQLFVGTPAGPFPGDDLPLPVGLQPRDAFGTVGGGGDVDGDGFDDFPVGAAARPSGGRVYLFAGSSGGVTEATELVSPTPVDGGLLGFRSSTSSDFDGDGYVDLVIAAPGEAGGAVPNAGRAYVFGGGPDGIATTPATSVFSANAEQRGFFGASVASGDLSGDGYADLAVASNETVAGVPSAGRVYVFLGGSTGLASAPARTLESTTSSALMGVPNFGAGLAIGDLSGDQTSDLLIGAAFDGDSGRVLIHEGEPTGVGATATAIIDAPATGTTWFGAACTLLGDSGGNGRQDFAVGAPAIAQVFVLDSSQGLIDTLDPPAGSTVGFGSALGIR